MLSFKWWRGALIMFQNMVGCTMLVRLRRAMRRAAGATNPRVKVILDPFSLLCAHSFLVTDERYLNQLLWNLSGHPKPRTTLSIPPPTFNGGYHIFLISPINPTNDETTLACTNRLPEHFGRCCTVDTHISPLAANPQWWLISFRS